MGYIGQSQAINVLIAVLVVLHVQVIKIAPHVQIL
jgi:hypothetical protein